MQRDVLVMASLGGAALLVMALFWKEFKLLSFDRDFGASLGFPMRWLDVLLTTLLVIAIVIGLQTVGVVLMSAMIVAPAAAARQWTDRLGVMVVLAGFFGALAGVSGAAISSSGAGLSTGPVIVLLRQRHRAGFAAVCAQPRPGLALGAAAAQQAHAAGHGRAGRPASPWPRSMTTPDHAHTIDVLRAMNLGRGGVQRTLLDAAGSRGWCANTQR